MFQFQKQRNNIEKTQSTSKSHSVFFNQMILKKKTLYLLCFLFVFKYFKCYGCVKLRFTLTILKNEQHKRTMKNINVLNPKI